MVTTRSRSSMNQQRTPERKIRKRVAASAKTESIASTMMTAITSLWLWGSNFAGELGFGEDIWEMVQPTLAFFGEKVLDAAVSGYHTVVIAEDHTVWSFGSNCKGALGRKTSNLVDVNGDPYVPERVDLSGIVGLPIQDGSILSWGDGNQSQLGRIHLRHSRRGKLKRRNMLTPTVIKAFRHLQFVDVFCGAFTTFLKISSGELYGCGLNFGQLAIDPSQVLEEYNTLPLEAQVEKHVTILQPMALENLNRVKVTKVASGDNHALGIDARGRVLSWGATTHGVLGREDTIPHVQDSTFLLLLLICHVSPLPQHPLLAISGCTDTNGDCYVWGAYAQDTLGRCDEEDFTLSRKIRRTNEMKDKQAVKISFGEQHAMMLSKDYETPRRNGSQ
eukprot:g2855.t1